MCFIRELNSNCSSYFNIGILFLLVCILVFGYLYRRRSRSKKFVLTIENLFDEMKSMKEEKGETVVDQLKKKLLHTPDGSKQGT